MQATVTLTEGRTYRYKSYIFTREPSTITDLADIEYLKTVGCLRVNVKQDGGGEEWVEAKPASAVKKASPPPKPGPKPQSKPGPKPSKPVPPAAKDDGDDKDD